MDANEFCYWLQGALELSDIKTMDEKQVENLKKHLALVLVNVTDSPPVKQEVAFVSRPGVNLPSFSSKKIC